MNKIINSLINGDCLNVLKENIPNNSIDLVYLDPPFNTELDWGEYDDSWKIENFENEWAEYIYDKYPKLDSILDAVSLIKGESACAYMIMMSVRLLELHRVLKDTGSIYLHCDQHASHYLKLVMDSIFGNNQFQNEIIWAYRTGGVSPYRFARKHDTIFFYSKTDKYTFNECREKSYIGLGKPGVTTYGHSGQEYEIFKDHGGTYRNVIMRDVWQMDATGTLSHERLGYPTQKPIGLLKRIIVASSNEGDLVLDPFMGSGTTMAAAQACNRDWIGIDINEQALKIAESRLYQSALL